MGTFRTLERGALASALIFGLTGAMSGCDSGTAKSEVKPIETGILKKLGQANQAQSDLAKQKLPASAKPKK